MQRRYRKRPPRHEDLKQFRANLQIKSDPVRLIDDESEFNDVVTLKEALTRAQEGGVDLVEVAPKANPPVVRLIDYGQFKYEQEKKTKKQRLLAKKSEVKGVRLTFRIKGADLDNRKKQALKFLEGGDNVKVEMQLRGRERAHKDLAMQAMRDFVKSLGENVSLVRPIDSMGARLGAEVMMKKKQQQNAPESKNN